MILCDREILMTVERGSIGITPLPEWGAKAWTSTALDLHLDAEICPWRTIEGAGEEPAINPMRPEFNTNKLIEKHTKPQDCTVGFHFKPKDLVLGWTIEKIRFPHTSRIAARDEGKSSLARIGLGVHITAPTIHAGFGVNPAKPSYPGSPIRLEIWNAGPLEIILTKGMPICQLILEEVHWTPEEGYRGAYAVQGPGGLKPAAKKAGRS